MFFWGIIVVGPKTENSFAKGLKREARNCQQWCVKRAQRPRGTVWRKKVRNTRWHTVLIDMLKTETNNFVLNPSLHWKPVECSKQCCCTCMAGLTKDKSGCMILYAPWTYSCPILKLGFGWHELWRLCLPVNFDSNSIGSIFAWKTG